MKIFRYVLTGILAGLFLYTAYYLYNRQQNTYHYFSFKINDNASQVYIPDLDRLTKKLRFNRDLSWLATNESLNTAASFILDSNNTGLNEIFGTSCLLSFDADNFSIAFGNPDFDFEQLVGFVKTELGLNASISDGNLIIAEKQYEANYYGTFAVISSTAFSPEKNPKKILFSNADYLLMKDSASVTRYILSGDQKFKVWNEIADPVRGIPLRHDDLITRVPASFEAVYYYGSQRFQEDKFSFFETPEEEAFNWIGDRMVVMKKGEYELVLAQPNASRDLRLILEESTLKLSGDSVIQSSINIKNSEIFPFKSNFNWQLAIPELTQELNYYTEFENFNILSNNLGAMQWFLSEVQLANLIGDREDLYDKYLQSTPIRSHQISILQQESDLFFESSIWIDKTKRTKAITEITKQQGELEGGKSFVAPFTPNFIQPFKVGDMNYLLLTNDRKAAVYTVKGEEQWNFDLPSDLIQKPSIVDLENDGKFEFVFFMKNKFLVLNLKGKTAGALSINLEEQIVGGLAANYDQKFDYRFFVITPSAVKLYNEQGKIVTGWTFKSGGVQLTGQSSYTQIDGLDYLSFLGTNDQLFVLNRRGENRFNEVVVPKLKNESQFITGQNQENLHKLGYNNQYIYRHYLKDGTTDSLKLDKSVNGVGERWILLDKPVLLIEESNRILVFDTFGYVVEEILKPQGATAFVRVESNPSIRFTFFNNSNNSLYLLEGDGRINLSVPSTNAVVYGLNETQLYTFDGKMINVHNLN